MALKLTTPPPITELKPRIVVVGVGGAGGNAVNNMIQSNLEGVEFIVTNTDAQALEFSKADRRIQLGTVLTQGLGAGAQPHVGRAAAEEAIEEIMTDLEGANMVFITAGMGGGTGTGAAPVIAEAARRSGILTVGVVTKPFQFEGSRRMKIADAGIEELQSFVDTLIIIPNQNLFRVANEKTTFADAFNMADDVLYAGVRGVTDLMVMPGLINLDFSDIRTVMSEMGKAMMGTGEADGDNRAITAAEAAISNPLLEDISMAGARGILINITGGSDMTLFEVDEAANRVRNEVDPDANIIFGSTFDEDLNGKMRVSVVATGIEADIEYAPRPDNMRPDNSVYDRQRAAHSYQTTNSTVTAEAAPAAPVSKNETAAATTNQLSDVLDNLPQEPAKEASPAATTEDYGLGFASTEYNTAPTETNQPLQSAAPAEAMPQEAVQTETPIVRPLPQNEADEQRPLVVNKMAATPKDTFIPNAPATREDYATGRANQEPQAAKKTIDPFNEADLVNAGPRSAVEKPKSKLSLRKLFFKDEDTAQPASETVPTSQHAQKPSMSGNTLAGNAEINTSSSDTSQEEDLLEIPSFLRRQAN